MDTEKVKWIKTVDKFRKEVEKLFGGFISVNILEVPYLMFAIELKTDYHYLLDTPQPTEKFVQIVRKLGIEHFNEEVTFTDTRYFFYFRNSVNPWYKE